ncbi:hypothetical protein NQ315_009853, partial [Exocentrus adspersus]
EQVDVASAANCGVSTPSKTQKHFLFLDSVIGQGFTFGAPLLLVYREEKSVVILTFTIVLVQSALQPKAPNFQYFERPKYRYPYYDENGVGRLLYGYGDDKLYQYKLFSPLEGIH